MTQLTATITPFDKRCNLAVWAVQDRDAKGLRDCFSDLMPMISAYLSAQTMTILIGAGDYDDMRWFMDWLERIRIKEVN